MIMFVLGAIFCVGFILKLGHIYYFIWRLTKYFETGKIEYIDTFERKTNKLQETIPLIGFGILAGVVFIIIGLILII